MNAFSFAPASRETARARVGLQGPAGSGKTKTALRLAEGLAQGGPIGLVDTERRSALTYAVVPGKPHLGGHQFGHMPMDSYDPRNLIQAVQAAEQAGIAVLIIDSWSHFWNGRGGLLEIVEAAGSGALGTFGGWKKGNPIEQDMLDALLNFSGHLIVTMRTKTDYLIDESGPKKKITKVGTKVVQRESSDYELGLIIDLVEGTGTVTKTRYEPLEGLAIRHPGEDLGRQILEQLGQGVDPVQQILDELFADGMTYQGAIDLHAQAKRRGILGHPAAHPVTGERSAVGDLIAERGKSLKPAAVPNPSPVAPAARTEANPDPAAGVNGSIPHSLADAAAAAGRLDTPEPATPPQMRRIHAVLTKAGITDRDERHAVLGALIGRQISTANELTKADAGEVIDVLDTSATQPDPAAWLREMARRTANADAA
ncbi:AAA family ATPase [Kitasatospora sp. NPDC056181]|uniref:AAA family ATPase n=1 Tax=Kitasatospora sp. NPDC056181 TaxID=3345737 RepID=UPI0035DD242B